MYSVGSTPNIKVLAKELIILGAALTVISQILSLYLIYAFTQQHEIYENFLLEENSKEEHKIEVSETNVILLTYNITVNVGGKVKIVVEFIGAGGTMINSSSIETSEDYGSLNGRVNIEGYLDSIVITVKGEGWNELRGTVTLNYTKSHLINTIASVVSALISILGLVIVGYGLFNYTLSKGETTKKPQAHKTNPPSRS